MDKQTRAYILQRRIKMHWRIKYWQWLNDCHGEWVRTGLMSKGNAEKTCRTS